MTVQTCDTQDNRVVPYPVVVKSMAKIEAQWKTLYEKRVNSFQRENDYLKKQNNRLFLSNIHYEKVIDHLRKQIVGLRESALRGDSKLVEVGQGIPCVCDQENTSPSHTKQAKVSCKEHDIVDAASALIGLSEKVVGSKKRPSGHSTQGPNRRIKRVTFVD